MDAFLVEHWGAMGKVDSGVNNPIPPGRAFGRGAGIKDQDGAKKGPGLRQDR
jgi:hypothetical protein